MSTETLRPNGAGYLMSLAPVPSTGGWNRIDEVSEDLNDYVYLISAAGGWCFFTLSAPTVFKSGDTVQSVTISGRWKLSNASAAPQGNHGLYIGTTQYPGTQFSETTTNTTYSQTWNTNPATGNAWTYEEIVAMQAGVYCKGNGSIPNYCYQAWVTVTFTAGVVGGRMCQVIII